MNIVRLTKKSTTSTLPCQAIKNKIKINQSCLISVIPVLIFFFSVLSSTIYLITFIYKHNFDYGPLPEVHSYI